MHLDEQLLIAIKYDPALYVWSELDPVSLVELALKLIATCWRATTGESELAAHCSANRKVNIVAMNRLYRQLLLLHAKYLSSR